jgi:hypothetical protein
MNIYKKKTENRIENKTFNNENGRKENRRKENYGNR